ncbi:MAG: Asp-tRNA(Asn)/Glu-tRNA(Gln) amidotransferase subunit GatA [Bacillota bacterium]|nr:Asp-tRNA(Asn)/Glu-tRNA(Gln) amidotransferase subunit GatA [Bacillota bacterium]
MKLYEKSAAELSLLLKKSEVSSVEIVQSFIDRIDRVEPQIKAFVSYTPESALVMARFIDDKRMRGEEQHPLAGIPVAVKDNICTEGIRTTCSSRILENFIPPYDAAVIESLKKAGMPLLGKTNLDEFAMGSSTENSAFHATRNPWNPDMVPGGSSGGSAAAVASAMVPLALGSDTGGSVRQPASFCGITGLRPTYGRVSRYGLIAFASSLDQIGPFSTTALDNALLLSVISGYDLRDSTSLPNSVPEFHSDLEIDCKNLRIGLIRQDPSDGFDPEVIAAVKKQAAFLGDAGAEIEEISLSMIDCGLGAYYLIAPSEASSNLGRYDGVRYGLCIEGEDIESMFSDTRGRGFGPEVKRRIIIGTYALSAGYYDAYYLQAMKVRTLIRREYEEAFKKYDLLLGATTPTPAFKLGEKVDDPLQMYLSDICNLNDALAGIPSLSVPSGIHSTGLPMGIQLSAPPLQEGTLLKIAHFLEQRNENHPKRPGIQLTEEGSA